jgi:hypothetical protein
MSLVLTGEWLGVERRAGSSVKDGVSTPWAFMQAAVLDGMDVRKLRVGDDYDGSLPGTRDNVQLLIEVRAYNRANGAAESGWTLLEWLNDPQGVNGDKGKG